MIERDIDLGEDGPLHHPRRRPGRRDRPTTCATFIFALMVTFALLGLALGFTTLLQIRFGLRPLANLRAALGAIRRGEAERIPGEYPRDIAPLAQRAEPPARHQPRDPGARPHPGRQPGPCPQDAAQHHRERGRERAGRGRRQGARAGGHDARPGQLLPRPRPRRGARRHARHPDRGRAGHRRARAHLRQDLPRQGPCHRARQSRRACASGASGRISRRWPATSSTTPRNGRRASRDLGRGQREDDSTAPASASLSRTTVPGCPKKARAEMLKRGRRLDETKPGSGLGLSIVSDLAALYRGSLSSRRPRSAGCGRCWSCRGIRG